MHQIVLDEIRLYCYHGCLQEEAAIGSDYTVNITLTTDFSTSCISDRLQDTIDYVHVYNIIKEEMAIRANLLEHVAQRIITRIKKELIAVTHVSLKVSKINPPMNGNVARVSIVIED